MYRGILASLGGIGIAASLAAPALAGPTYTAVDLLDSFNVITSGDMTTSSETEGAVLVGGNLGPGTGGLDNKSGSATITSNLSSSFAPVSVYGNASGAWTVTAGDAVMIGGTNTATFANSATPTSPATFAISSSAVQQTLQAYSTSLAGQTSTPIVPTAGNLTFTGLQNGGTDYFTITLQELANATSVAFNLGTGANEDTAVINVTGAGAFTDPFNFTGSVDDSHVLWNFEDATSLSVTGWEGTVLALDASVTNTSAINGTIASASFAGNGEAHSHPFTPPDSPPSPPTPPTNVPEPGTLPLLASALIGMMGLRRWNRRARLNSPAQTSMAIR